MGNPAREYESTLNQIKASKRATQQDFIRAQEQLAEAREQKLAALQEEVNRRRAVIALRRSRERREAARKLSGDKTPTVEAIMAVADNRPAALIEDAFVYEGDTVKGYRVRKIRTDSVEFEKDGEVWVQKVQ